jgi:hypothetical protein
MRFIRKFHRLLLNLYPQKYREEYGEELHTVFSLSLDDATGWVEVITVFLRELTGLPQAILYENLRERRKTKMTGIFASRFDFEPGSRNETLAALAPFLLIGALPTLFSYIGNSVEFPMWIQVVFTLFMWILVGGLLIIGFKKGVPRWFMPYLGFPLPILCVLIFNGWIVPDKGGFDAPWLIQQFIGAGLIWGSLILLTVILVLISVLVKRFQPFYQRLRDDWTLLSFLLYGSVPFIAVVGFEGYKNNEIYLATVFLFLAAGGGLYLRNENPWKKFLSLFGGLTLSMLVIAVGQTVLYEISFPNSLYPWWTMTTGTAVTWIWLALIMLLPLALNLFPGQKEIPEAV